MTERNVIGGTAAVILTPFVEGWPRLAPYLLLAFVLIIVDLRFGIQASRARGEVIRRSRAIRRSINKMIDYLCWVAVAWLFGLTFGAAFDVPIVTYVVLAVIYGIELQSIIDNYLDCKGIKKRFNVFKFIARLFGRTEIIDSLDETDR